MIRQVAGKFVQGWPQGRSYRGTIFKYLIIRLKIPIRFGDRNQLTDKQNKEFHDPQISWVGGIEDEKSLFFCPVTTLSPLMGTRGGIGKKKMQFFALSSKIRPCYMGSGCKRIIE